MQIDFTASDIADARRMNAKLNRLPRLRMETPLGRVILNGLLRVAQQFRGKAVRDKRVTIERRAICALGREVDVRIIRTAQPVRGVILDIHGGGFTIGNAKMDDESNAKLALDKGFATVSIDYGLALGQPIAESVADCEAAALWTLDNAAREFGTSRVLLVAKSAGATRDEHDAAARFAGVMLFFGLYDFSGQPSVRDAGPDTLLLHGPTIRATLRKLAPDRTDAERRDPKLSPLYADLRGLPPALFIVGDIDPLIDDTLAMERAWRDANHNCELIVAPASPHGFNRLSTAIAAKVNACTEGWMETRFAVAPPTVSASDARLVPARAR